MPAEPLVSARDLVCSYGEIRAVDGVGFDLERGEVLGLLGPNGAGKTTTLEVVSGVRPPDRGQVSIGGHDLREEPRAAKRRLGYLPERPPLDYDLTVDEYLRFCARLHGIGRAAAGPACERAKARCGLGDVGRRLIGHLSKGFQQRIGIAQAIIHRPRVTIFDEPTVGLDPLQIREIRALIRDLAADHGVILSTHVLSEVQAVCDRVLIMHAGRIVLDRPLHELARGERGATTRVAFRRAPPGAALEALPPVRTATALGRGRFRLTQDGSVGPAEAVVAASVEHGWGLVELVSEGGSLEELFIALTSRDAAPARGDGRGAAGNADRWAH